MKLPTLCLLLCCTAGSARGQLLLDGTQIRFDVAVAGSQDWLRYDLGEPRLSEHHYRNMATGGARLRVVYHPDLTEWAIMLGAEWGEVAGGSFRDSDYRSNGTEEHSRSISQLNGSTTRSRTVGVGRTFALQGAAWPAELVAWLGYRQSRWTMRIRDGVQELPEFAPDTILDGLDSRYRTKSGGAWIGATASGTAGPGIVEVHLAIRPNYRFSGEGEWNLRDDLMQPRSFTQAASASGATLELRYVRELARRVAFVLSASAHREIAWNGRDIMFFRDGLEHRVSLHELSWGGFALMAGLSTSF